MLKLKTGVHSPRDTDRDGNQGDYTLSQKDMKKYAKVAGFVLDTTSSGGKGDYLVLKVQFEVVVYGKIGILRFTGNGTGGGARRKKINSETSPWEIWGQQNHVDQLPRNLDVELEIHGYDKNGIIFEFPEEVAK
ncbi:hypothetical protein HN911_13760 [Candidatus Bathyarchaeota archaeon]|jgi:hypothetical protein|nr:hypothetical protein [Candidatus Bathyarchaeota archaeon]